MNLIESKKFISEEIFNNFENDKELCKFFDIILWKDLSSIYLKSKINNLDGYILTLMPYLDSMKEYCYYLTIISVDSEKNPKSQDIKFVECESSNIEIIKKYISSPIPI